MEKHTIEEKEERLIEVLMGIEAYFSSLEECNIKIVGLQQLVHGILERIRELQKEQGKLLKEIRELKKLKEENS